MTIQTLMIMALLFFMNAAFGLYTYMRFGPKQKMMQATSQQEYDRYDESLPPITRLNAYGRTLALIACLTVVVSLLLLSELLLVLPAA